ncbi:MAG: hypothetical protein ACRDAO_00540 [Culicoidibacterales bacterium]
MEIITKRQIYQVLIGLLATVGFYWLVDYPLTSTAIIANFIILLISPTKQRAQMNIKGQIYAQIVGISVGVVLAFLMQNAYSAITCILLIVLTLPFWFRVEIPSLALTIAAYAIFQSESVAGASLERLLVTLVSLAIAFGVSWIFAVRYTLSKSQRELHHQFLLLSRAIHEVLWRGNDKQLIIELPQIPRLPAEAKQMLLQYERELMLLQEALFDVHQALYERNEDIPLIVHQELRYALQIHYVLLNQVHELVEPHMELFYEVSETVIVSTWEHSRSLAVTLVYLQRLEQAVTYVNQGEVAKNQQ